MTFIWPALLVTVLLVPLGVLAGRAIDARRRGRVEALTGTRPGSTTTTSTTTARPSRTPLDRVAAGLVVAAFVVFAIALARPVATVAVPRLEGTLMLTFDVSGSMAATDVEPSRMEVAKALANALVEQRPSGVVIGVVAFSNGGMAVQAPTDDPVAVTAAIARMTPTEGTSLGAGIVEAVEAIVASRADTPASYYSDRSAEPSEPPDAVEAGSDAATIMVLFTDGENTDDADPAEAAQVAADHGIRIVTVGIGTTEGQALDLDGFSVLSRLDEATLQRIADVSEGAYVAAAEADPAADVYAELERRLVARSETQELTALVAALGLLLLSGGVALSLARTGRLP